MASNQRIYMDPMLVSGPNIVQPILTGNVAFHMPPERQLIFPEWTNSPVYCQDGWDHH